MHAQTSARPWPRQQAVSHRAGDRLQTDQLGGQPGKRRFWAGSVQPTCIPPHPAKRSRSRCAPPTLQSPHPPTHSVARSDFCTLTHAPAPQPQPHRVVNKVHAAALLRVQQLSGLRREDAQKQVSKRFFGSAAGGVCTGARASSTGQSRQIKPGAPCSPAAHAPAQALSSAAIPSGPCSIRVLQCGTAVWHCRGTRSTHLRYLAAPPKGRPPQQVAPVHAAHQVLPKLLRRAKAAQCGTARRSAAQHSMEGWLGRRGCAACGQRAEH